MRALDRDSWMELLQVFLRNPFRTFLSGLGVGWGLFMILITVAASSGLENGVKADIGDRARNSMFLWTQGTSMPYAGYRQGRYFEIDTSDVAWLQEQAKSITVVAPRNQLGGWRGANNVSHGLKSGAFNIYGDIPEYQDIEPVLIRSGRYLNQADLDAERKVAVIGERVRDILFEPGEEVLGKPVTINGVNFQVVGVYGTLRTGEDAEDAANSIFVPFSTFGRAFHRGDEVGWLSLLIDESINADTAAAEVVSLLKARKSVHPDDERAFGWWSMATEFEEVESVFEALRWVSFVFGGLALVAGVIGIVNIMLITVKERTKELGIRRALGATPGEIVRSIIGETLLLTFFAGLTGAIVGVWLIEGVSSMLADMPDTGSFRNPEVSFEIVTQTLFTMMFMGALAGILPAVRAVSIRPVEAIRTE
jgi:putative ABC transport system permease protein